MSENKQMSLRECAFEDAKKHGLGAIEELTIKCRKRSLNKKSRRGKNTAKRDARNALLLSKGGK